MPITVKHGGGLPGLAGILQGQGQYATRESQLRGQDLARIYGEQFQDKRLGTQIAAQKSMATERARTQAGIAAANNAARRSMQAASLQTQRANSNRQIQAQAQRQSQAADQAYKRMAVQSGLQGELQEQAFDREVKMLEEKARQEASRRKLVYTEEGKRTIAEANTAKDWAAKAFSEGTIDRRQLEQINYQADAMSAGVKQHFIPDESKKFSEGQGPGEMWPDQFGNIVSMDENGKIFRVSSYKESKEYLQAEQERIAREAVIKKSEELEKAKRTFVAKTVGSKYTAATPAVGASWSDWTGEEAGEEDRIHTIASAEALADQIFGQRPQQAAQPIAPRQAPSPQQQVPLPQAQQVKPWEQPEWWNDPRLEGVALESDKRLPAKIGFGKATIRLWSKKFGYDRKKWPMKNQLDAIEIEEEHRQWQIERKRRARLEK